MHKRVVKIFVLILSFCLVTGVGFAYGDGKPPKQNTKKGNFSKKTFSNDNTWSRSGKALAPPDPGGGGGGNPIPISNGLLILIIGSSVYLLKKIKNDTDIKKE
jgi:hypothetical protein